MSSYNQTEMVARMAEALFTTMLEQAYERFKRDPDEGPGVASAPGTREQLEEAILTYQNWARLKAYTGSTWNMIEPTLREMFPTSINLWPTIVAESLAGMLKRGTLL